MSNRIDFKALTLIIGIIVVLIILLFVQVFSPTQSVSLNKPLDISIPLPTVSISIQEIGKFVLELVW